MGKTWFQVISDEIKKRIADLQEALGDGAAKSYDQYREIVGNIKGLRATQMYVEDLARAYKEQEDD